jgi:hypothetical protein
MYECASCLENSIHTLATTHSINPDFAGYELCNECAAEYDARRPQTQPAQDAQADPQEGLGRQICDAMIDIRHATGDTTYCLEWDDALAVTLMRGGEGQWRVVSPTLSPEMMALYLAAFAAGVDAGYLAAKRGR